MVFVPVVDNEVDACVGKGDAVEAGRVVLHQVGVLDANHVDQHGPGFGRPERETEAVGVRRVDDVVEARPVQLLGLLRPNPRAEDLLHERES